MCNVIAKLVIVHKMYVQFQGKQLDTYIKCGSITVTITCNSTANSYYKFRNGIYYTY